MNPRAIQPLPHLVSRPMIAALGYDLTLLHETMH